MDYEALIIEDPATVYESADGRRHVVIDVDGTTHFPTPGFLSVEVYPRQGFDAFGNVLPE